MNRRTFVMLSTLAATTASGINVASSQSEDFIAAMLIDAETGVDGAKALEAAKKIAAGMREVDGLLDATLLQSSIKNNNPAFVHIMRWRTQRDWENMMASEEMQKLFDEYLPLLKIRPAEAFTEVK